jgi:RNA polymerase sigma-70 factor (ECF subfamily)
MNEAELRTEMEQHHTAAYGWALNCCSRCPELAEDVLQMAYLKILDGRARFDGGAVFKTWLFSVIRLTAIDEQRRLWLRRFRLGNAEPEPAIEMSVAGEGLDGAERLAIFQVALARLPKRQKEVLHLAFYQGLSLSEASQVMGLSLGSARTHYERGKSNLQAQLKKSKLFREYGQK